ncbi:MAG: M16 family metallopeptidase [Bacteroidales bacterium]
MEYQTHTLTNGIRLIHKQVPGIVAHCGFIINTGSRDEEPGEEGMAHFIEHAVFKGTKRRKPYHIISRLEDVGGDINAYTTKEETCIHASFLNTDYKRAMELMSDMIFNSVFPEKEIEREKEIIIDEINSYRDNPSELIFDEFEELIYEGNSLAGSVLGTEASVKSFARDDITRFIDENYHTNEMVLASVGNISFPRVKKYFEMYFDTIPLNMRDKRKYLSSSYLPKIKREEKDTYQAHCVIGNVAYNLKDKRRAGLHLLNNILGGPGMNSRLNMSLREKNGYTYSVEANYTPYIDSGSLVIYFGTDKENLEKSIHLAMKEFKELRDKKLGTLQLSRAKKQLIGQIAISSENNENYMLGMGKSYMIYDKVDTVDEIAARINKLSAMEIQEIANEILDKNRLSTLIYT